MNCQITDCNRPAKVRNYCRMHYKRWLRTGKPEIKGIANFKGDSAGYLAIHVRLRKAKGRASEHFCFLCTNPANEWAYDNDDPNEKEDQVSGYTVKYIVDLTHYIPLCVSCHRKFDQRR